MYQVGLQEGAAGANRQPQGRTKTRPLRLSVYQGMAVA